MKSFIITCMLFLYTLCLSIGLGKSISQNKELEETTVSKSLCKSSNIEKWWKPRKGTTWQYQLKSPFKSFVEGVDVYDIDLFDNEKSDIVSIKKHGKKVICYFSAGSYEDWRPDKSKFAKSDLGKPLDGWKGERWLDIKSKNVRNIMKSRLDMAKEKNCDGVDPDNIDGYDNDNGLKLTKKDSIDFIKFLSKEAHARNLSIGLKNGGSIVKNVVDHVEWSVQEQCVQYEECDKYVPFIKANKPVFNVEYPKGDDVNNNKNISSSKLKKICNAPSTTDFSTIVKNMDLDYWIQTCHKK